MEEYKIDLRGMQIAPKHNSYMMEVERSESVSKKEKIY